MPLEEIQEESYFTLGQDNENKIMNLIKEVKHVPEKDAFARSLMRRIFIEEPELAKVMHNELAYWINHAKID